MHVVLKLQGWLQNVSHWAAHLVLLM